MKPISESGPKRGKAARSLDLVISNMPDDYRASFLKRVSRYIIRAEGHWLWKGTFTGKYPVIGVCYSHSPLIDGRAQLFRFKGLVLVHRALYVIKNGVQGPGIEIDHKCSARTYCVKPTHLEAVTPEVNRERYFTSPEGARRYRMTVEEARRRNEDDPELDKLLMAIKVWTG